MLGYYWQLVREAPGIALRAAHGLFSLLTLAACVVVAFSRGAASALTAPSLFALIPVGLLFLYGLLRANYQHYQAVQNRSRELASQVEKLGQSPPPQRVIHEQKRDPFPLFGNVQPFDSERWTRQRDEEYARQGRLLGQLHAEYMEEHPNAPRRVRLRTAQLPKKWVINRLKEMGEWERNTDWQRYQEFWPPP